MEQTLQALGGILLKAIPTAILFGILHFYLKGMLFKPLQRILKQREELTAGARKAAEQSLALADQKARDYETKFRDARAEVYRQQEETRRSWIEDQTKQIDAAHDRSMEVMLAAQKKIGDDSAKASQDLVETSGALAESIANTVLGRRRS